MKKLIFSFLCFISFSAFAQDTLYLNDGMITGAYPGIVGWGKNAIGPQLPTPWFITSLSNSSSPGTIRAALNGTTPRTVIPRVYGTIDLSGINPNELRPNSENVYYAGQAAPGGGLVLKNGGIRLYRSHQVIRHLIVYGGSDLPSPEDSFRMTSSSDAVQLTDLVFDNCTGAYAPDEVMSVAYTRRVTITDCIVADGTDYGTLLGSGNTDHRAEDVTYYRNLQVWNEQRNPRLNHWGSYEIVNNFFYGTSGSYNSREAMLIGMQTTTDVIGNHWRNDTGTGTQPIIRRSTSLSNIQAPLPQPGLAVIHMNDNLFDGGTANVVDPAWAQFETVSPTPLKSTGLTIIPASQVPSSVLATAGAYAGLPQGQDSYVAKIKNDIINNVSSGYINSNFPFPTIQAGLPYPDEDSDGLSDAYELINGGNTTSTSWSGIPGIAKLTDGRVINQQRDVTNWATEGANHGWIFMGELAKDFDGFTFGSNPGGPGPGPVPGPGKKINKGLKIRF